MKQNKRQKLCYHCEGEVDLEVIFCPFCGTDLLEESNGAEESEKIDPDAAFRTLSEKQSNSSLYPPPYLPKSSVDDDAPEEVQDLEEEIEKEKSAFLPLIFLSMGAWLLALAVLLFVFSKNGFVTLRFDAKMWLVYLLISAPLLFAGSKLMGKMD